MSPALQKRLLAFENCVRINKKLIITNETITHHDVNCLIALLSNSTGLRLLSLEQCTLNISDDVFCQLLAAVAASKQLNTFCLTGKPAGYPAKFSVDNQTKLSAIRHLIQRHGSLKKLSLANLIYNRHYIQKIVEDAKQIKINPLALEFGAVLVDLPRVAAEVDKLNEAAAKAANDKNAGNNIPKKNPSKFSQRFNHWLTTLKIKFNLPNFMDKDTLLPMLL